MARAAGVARELADHGGEVAAGAPAGHGELAGVAAELTRRWSAIHRTAANASSAAAGKRASGAWR